MSFFVPSKQLFTPELLIPGRVPSGLTVLNREHPIAKGLVGWWLMDEGFGFTAHDASGHGNDGTLQNMAASNWVAGRRSGKALNFDGSDDYVDVGDINELDGVAQFSISFWINTDSRDEYDAFFSKRVDDSNRIVIGTGGTAVGDTDSLMVIIANGSNAYSYTGAVLSDNAWIHCTVVYDGNGAGNSDKVKAYINGVEKSLTFPVTMPSTTDSNSSPLEIGRENTEVGRYTDGQIDDGRIYNRALSAVEIRRIFTHPYEIVKPPGPEYLLFGEAAAPGGFNPFWAAKSTHVIQPGMQA